MVFKKKYLVHNKKRKKNYTRYFLWMYEKKLKLIFFKCRHSFLSNSCLALLQQYYTVHPSHIFVLPSNNLLVFEL